jgi:hypothetical protein
VAKNSIYTSEHVSDKTNSSLLSAFSHQPNARPIAAVMLRAHIRKSSINNASSVPIRVIRGQFHPSSAIRV